MYRTKGQKGRREELRHYVHLREGGGEGGRKVGREGEREVGGAV